MPSLSRLETIKLRLLTFSLLSYYYSRQSLVVMPTSARMACDVRSFCCTIQGPAGLTKVVAWLYNRRKISVEVVLIFGVSNIWSSWCTWPHAGRPTPQCLFSDSQPSVCFP